MAAAERERQDGRILAGGRLAAVTGDFVAVVALLGGLLFAVAAARALAGAVAGSFPALAATGSLIIDKEKRYQKGISPWPVCLDTATIRPASLKEKIRIA